MLPLDGVFLKPLLAHGKEELRQYLISNNFTWREVWMHGMFIVRPIRLVIQLLLLRTRRTATENIRETKLDWMSFLY
jgi:hypothetical protein